MFPTKVFVCAALVLVYLEFITCSDNKVLENIINSYVSSFSDKFYPCIPQIIKIFSRNKIIANYYDSAEGITGKLQIKPWVLNEYKNSLLKTREFSEDKTEFILKKNQIRTIKNSNKKDFHEFLDELFDHYNQFGLDNLFDICSKVNKVGIKLWEYIKKNNNNIIELEKRWSKLVNYVENSVNYTEFMKLKRKIHSSILNHFIVDEKVEFSDVDVEKFNIEFYSSFWKNNIPYWGLINYFEEYNNLQLVVVYNLKLIKLKLSLIVWITNIENKLLKIHDLAKNTKVHKLTLTSLEHLFKVKDRIDNFLYNEQYYGKLLEIYKILLVDMITWVNLGFVLDDLQFLYIHLLKNGLEMRELLINCSNMLNIYYDLKIDKENVKRHDINDKTIKITKYLNLKESSFIHDVDHFVMKTFYYKNVSNVWDALNKNTISEYVLFISGIENDIFSELETKIRRNNQLFDKDKLVVNLIDNLKHNFQLFDEQSNVFITELQAAKLNSMLLSTITIQSGNSLYEVISNSLLIKTENRDNTDKSSNKKFVELIEDMDSVKESIDAVKDIDEDSGTTDIFGETVSEEDFIYVPGAIGNPRSIKTSSFGLITRISIIITMLILIIILYLSKIGFFSGKYAEDDLNYNERYCSRVSLEKLEFESNNEERHFTLKEKPYKLDRKSGNIILKNRLESQRF